MCSAVMFRPLRGSDDLMGCLMLGQAGRSAPEGGGSTSP
jgi:hypothetical protein